MSTKGNVVAAKVDVHHEDEISEEHEQSEVASEIASEYGNTKEEMRLLRNKRISTLASVTKKRNEITKLMKGEKNLHIVKDSLEEFSTLVENYEQAYLVYCLELPEKEGEKEAEQFEQKSCTISRFKREVLRWISIMEERLQDQMDRLSEAGSKRSQLSRTSSRASSKSARAKEKAKIAELLIERNTMREKQALQAKQQELELDIELAKARARENIYASELNQATEDDGESDVLSQLSKQVKNAIEDSTNPAQHTKDGDDHKIELDPRAISFQPRQDKMDFITLQQEQNAQILATHQMLAAAVSLPHPEIPKFKGDPMDYNSFIRAFDARIVSLTSSDADKLYYLEQHLQGEARDLVGGCLYMDPAVGYTEARALLLKEYGDPYKVSMSYINKALSWPNIKYDDSQALRLFSFFLTKCSQAMQSMSHMVVLNHAPNMQVIVQKLPVYLQNKWRESVGKMKTRQHRIPVFGDLVIFIQESSETANDPVYGKQALHKNDGQPKTKSKEVKGTRETKHESTSFVTEAKNDTVQKTTSQPSEKYKKQCLFCKGAHDIDDCHTFADKTNDNKIAFLKEKRVCFGCFGSNHTSKGCLRKRTCKKCSKRHPTILHIDGYTSNNKDKNETDTTNKVSWTSNRNEVGEEVNNASTAACHITDIVSTVLHSILPVRVRQKGKETTILTYAFIDNGSSGCFISEELEQQLKASSTDTTLQLRTMHGTNYVKSRIVHGLVCADINGEHEIELPKAFTRKEIPVNHHQIPKPEMMQVWPHLAEVANYLPEYMPNVTIGLLIGSNCPKALQPVRVVPAQSDGPYAVLLHHGWTINGPLHIDVQQQNITCNRIVFQEMQSIKEVPQPSSLMKIFERDFTDLDIGEVPGEVRPSLEDKKFLDKVQRCVKDTDGHYKIPLPFREEELIMPNNRASAVSRAIWQKKKMLRDAKYHKDYVAFIDTMLKNGYAIKPESHSSSLPKGKVWFLPHHGVYHPKKPEKIRVVFDCSAKFNNMSLNDKLLPGPNLTNSIVGVLTRFREEPVAFMADIEAMFHQVRVPAEQQQFLRFLWWPNGNLDSELQEYRMAVHLFGAVSSPSVSNFALKRSADENEESHGLTAANTVRRNFHVDDCLKSMPDEESAKLLVKNVREVCRNGGFRLTKFTSNSCDVLNSIPQDERSKQLQTRDLDYDPLPIERALGLQWSVEHDEFKFSVMIAAKPPSRRGILSMISSIYDPLGFLAPFILPAKRILQDLCQGSGTSWDAEVPDEYKCRWEKWLIELPNLEMISIRRCFKPPSFGTVTSRELHVFSDASNVGYGCVSYLRQSNSDGAIHTSFLMGKARLAPMKKITIPRLELTAATVSLKMGRLLDHELEVKPDRIIYHTDSTTVLHFINSQRKRFPVFVANRVQLIHDFSTPDQWKYVDSKSNPADVASRGLHRPQMINQTCWLNGPEFLLHPEDSWPKQPVSFDEDTDSSANAQICDSNMTSVSEAVDSVNKLIEHFSNWHNLKKAVAVFLMVQQILLHRKMKGNSSVPNGDPFNVDDLKLAEIGIIKFIQAEYFEAEVHALRQNDPMTDSKRGREKLILKNSRLYRLYPFVDTNGVLRVGGRLSKANIGFETKHPILLPQKSHVSKLIVRDIHQWLGHAGRNHVVASLRETYWILQANTLVRQVIAKCVSCRRYRTPVCEQKMADLPPDRLSPSAPFTYTGVDLFGPFLIKERRTQLKRYGVLFTCLVSRAVHIETANTLTTDSFLQALRRFIARRGSIRLIRSDNGTNFVGARKELWRALEEMDHSNLREEMLKHSIDWKFNPPSASHAGGVWERQIRTVRKVFAQILNEFVGRLDDESLRTLFCEVELIVNSRPLTTASGDPDDLNPLTPNHLLTLKSSVTLPPPGHFQRDDVLMRKHWRRVQYLANLFWSRWKREYVQNLQIRQKWNRPNRNLKVGDIVLMKEENMPRNKWNLGRVSDVEEDQQGFVRSVQLRTQTSDFRRPINKLVLILPVEEQDNSS